MMEFMRIFLTSVLFVIFYGVLLINCEKVRTVPLEKSWTLRNQNGSIVNTTAVPSSVYGVFKKYFGDILLSQNDVDLRWMVNESWTYSNKFSFGKSDPSAVNLTFYGIDTIATIRLNNHVIGRTDNMFVRYSFDVKEYLEESNVLEIELMSPIQAAKLRMDALKAQGKTAPPECPPARENGECHRNMLRKMQASFGSHANLAAPSMGIWQPVLLEYYEVAIVRDIDVAVYKNQTHWTMDIRIFLTTNSKHFFYGELTVFAPELLDEPVFVAKQKIRYITPKIELQVAVPKEKVHLWWPNGYGSQKLYPLFFSVNCWKDYQERPEAHSRTISQKSLKIGFRTVELVEDKDEHGRTFYFKVNDHPIFIKGANYIPAHILPELSADPEKVRHLLKSAYDSHMNMIRVWGGGLYESDYFYSLADNYGLLVWQDMAFTDATYPVTDEFVNCVRLETVQNAQRLAYHPSLALIVTNDEVELYLVNNKTDFGADAYRLEEEYKQLFAGTIKFYLNTISRNEFGPRAGPLLSTPSLGEAEGKDLPKDPQNPNYGDIHFWDDEKDCWDPAIYPSARFVSEYGFQSLPALTSWQYALGVNDSVANLIKHRQHDPKSFRPIMQLIQRHFPFDTEHWEDNIEAFIYFSQVAQAMATKTATEVFRSQRDGNRTMGALYWQLNDAWIAPSWSSIDFFGNYKIVYYWSKIFLAPISIIALYDATNDNINITLVRDDKALKSDVRSYKVSFNIYLWSELYAQKTRFYDRQVESNSVDKLIVPLKEVLVKPFDEHNCFLEFVLLEKDKTIASTFFFPGTISKAVGMGDPELKTELTFRYCNDDVVSDQRVTIYSITIHVSRPALFVYIEISHPKVSTYKLSHNGFIQVEPVKIIHLEVALKHECLTLGPSDIRVQTVNKYMPSNNQMTKISSRASHVQVEL